MASRGQYLLSRDVSRAETRVGKLAKEATDYQASESMWSQIGGGLAGAVASNWALSLTGPWAIPIGMAAVGASYVLGAKATEEAHEFVKGADGFMSGEDKYSRDDSSWMKELKQEKFFGKDTAEDIVGVAEDADSARIREGAMLGLMYGAKQGYDLYKASKLAPTVDPTVPTVDPTKTSKKAIEQKVEEEAREVSEKLIAKGMAGEGAAEYAQDVTTYDPSTGISLGDETLASRVGESTVTKRGAMDVLRDQGMKWEGTSLSDKTATGYEGAEDYADWAKLLGDDEGYSDRLASVEKWQKDISQLRDYEEGIRAKKMREMKQGLPEKSVKDLAGEIKDWSDWGDKDPKIKKGKSKYKAVGFNLPGEGTSERANEWFTEFKELNQQFPPQMSKEQQMANRGAIKKARDVKYAQKVKDVKSDPLNWQAHQDRLAKAKADESMLAQAEKSVENLDLKKSDLYFETQRDRDAIKANEELIKKNKALLASKKESEQYIADFRKKQQNMLTDMKASENLVDKTKTQATGIKVTTLSPDEQKVYSQFYKADGRLMHLEGKKAEEAWNVTEGGKGFENIPGYEDLKGDKKINKFYNWYNQYK